MKKNQQDRTEKKLLPTEGTSAPTLLSPQDQSGTDQLQEKNQLEKTIEQLRKGGYKVTEEYDSLGHISRVSAEPRPQKTRWDWFQLILQVLAAIAIPFSIGLGAWQFTTQLAANQAQVLDQQRQTTLDTYFDRMSDLLLTHPDHFKVSQQGDQYQAMAQARTYTAVRNLDGVRKGTLVRFLLAAGLIERSGPIISMFNADLSGAIFTNAGLSEANLSYANLSEATFANADLSGADLSYANLSRATFANVGLSGADLSEADLIGTVFTNTGSTGLAINYNCSGCSPSSSNGVSVLDNTRLGGAMYNTKPAQEGTQSLPPTQWPQGFDPRAAGALCIDC